MIRYHIRFQVTDFDRAEEEHHLTVHVHNVLLDAKKRHQQAAHELIKFVARLLNIPADKVAARAIVINSIWVNDGSKRQRLTPKVFLESVIETGEVSPRGRGLGRIEKAPLRRRMQRK